MTIDDAMRHAGDPYRVEMEIIAEIQREMPRYLWVVDRYMGDTGLIEYDDMGECRLVHCEVCERHEVQFKGRRGYGETLPHNSVVRCAACGAKVTVKHVTKGIKGVYDRLNVTFYRKSAVNPRVVVGIGAFCSRNFSGADTRAPWETPLQLDPRCVCVFDADGGEVYQAVTRPVFVRSGRSWVLQDVFWKQIKAVKMMHYGDGTPFMSEIPNALILKGTLEDAIAGTPLARSWSEAYWFGDGVAALELCVTRPCVEYMTRLGLTELPRRKVRGDLPKNLINWRGNTMAKVLKISRERIGQAKGKGIQLTPELIEVLQYVDKHKIRCGIETAAGVAISCRAERTEISARLDLAISGFEGDRRHKALKFIARNKEHVIRDITDYWEMCARAGNDLKDDGEAFPRHFDEAHERVAKRVKLLGDVWKDRRIAMRLPDLQERYGFEFGGLILRPAVSSEEIIREGEALHHCVGSYTEKYAAGQTVICVLRRAVQPDAPWRTVEISAATGKLVQDRGLHNDWGKYDIGKSYRAALDLFWEAWNERKIKKRVRVSA